MTALAFPLWFGEAGVTGLYILLHPIIHHNWAPHLASNIVFALVAGTLIESWTMVTCRTRLGLLGVCYASSLVADFMKWKYIGPDLALVIGLSGMVSAAIGVLVIYYYLFRHQIRLDGVGWLAPLGIGFLSWFLIVPFYNAIFVPFQPSDSVNFHLIAFFVACFPAYLLLRRSRANITGRKHPPNNSLGEIVALRNTTNTLRQSCVNEVSLSKLGK